ncbi:hypothetical protein ACKFKF_10405 [Phormidesmis sp. 146-12]
MSQRVLYIDSHAAAKATNVSDQIKAITAWMDQLLGSSHDGKIVKEIRHFHIEKRNALVWNLIVVVDVE